MSAAQYVAQAWRHEAWKAVCGGTKAECEDYAERYWSDHGTATRVLGPDGEVLIEFET